MNYCLCGCGTEIKSDRRFVSGHNSRNGGSSWCKSRPPWNKGLTKEISDSVAIGASKVSAALTGRKISYEIVEKQRRANTGKKRTGKALQNIIIAVNKPEYKEKLRLAITGKKRSSYTLSKMRESARREDVIERKLRNGYKKYYYLSKSGKEWFMRSSWEIQYAIYLDGLKLNWVYEKRKFKTEFGWYYPDFYIENLDEYHEVKGYLSDIAKQKLRSFKSLYPQEKLKIIDKSNFDFKNYVSRKV